MLEALVIEGLTADFLLLLAFVAIIVGVLMGYLTDAIMGSRGFGPFGNGMLILLGSVIGIYVRYAYFGSLQPGDAALTSLFAAASASLVLLLLGFAKYWVQE